MHYHWRYFRYTYEEFRSKLQIYFDYFEKNEKIFGNFKGMPKNVVFSSHRNNLYDSSRILTTNIILVVYCGIHL
jgi:hypothetical protein